MPQRPVALPDMGGGDDGAVDIVERGFGGGFQRRIIGAAAAVARRVGGDGIGHLAGNRAGQSAPGAMCVGGVDAGMFKNLHARLQREEIGHRLVICVPALD